VAPLQRIEDQVIEIPFADPLDVLPADRVQVGRERGRGDVPRLEPGVQRRKVGPGDRLRRRRQGDSEKCRRNSERGGNGEYTHRGIVTEDGAG
jgi:hypothetical protein